MDIKLLLEIIFFSVAVGVPIASILEYKDIQIRNLKKRIDAANNFISEYACKNCPGSPNHCPECKFNDITVALQIGRPSCQFLKKQEENKGNVNAD